MLFSVPIFMRKSLLFFLLFTLPEEEIFAQMSAEAHKAFGNQVEFINQSCEKVQGMTKSFFDVYQSLKSAKNDKKHHTAPRYTCPMKCLIITTPKPKTKAVI